MRRLWLGLLVGLVALVGLPGTAAAASASVDDTTPGPGQTITVRASGLLAGTDISIDFLPDAVHLATVVAGDDGSFSRQVTIPPDTINDRKQVVVSGFDDEGNFAYLPIDVTVTGSAASATVSDRDLTPNQVVEVSGTRFRAGGPVNIDLLPEAERLAELDATADRRFSTTIRIPPDTTNGNKQIVVSGIGADGQYAYVPIDVTVTGSTATAEVSSRALTPGKRITVTGERFGDGSPIAVDLLPEAERLGTTIVEGGQSFTLEVQIPDPAVNGAKQIVVSGIGADGLFAYVPLDAELTGGIELTVPTSTPGTIGPLPEVTSPERPRFDSTTTTRRPFRETPSAGGGILGRILLLLLLLLLAAALLIGWLRSEDGRRWLARQRARRRRRSGPGGPSD